jgi:hypothetical protein
VAATQHFLLVEVAAVGQDRRDPGAQALALDKRAVADEDTGHVHERVQLTRGEATDGVTELA